MGVFKKIQSIFHDDWCSKCQNKLEETSRTLYLLPMMVGHYVSHGIDVEYYKKHLRQVEKKADIPTGYYACGVIQYRCSNLECLKEVVKLSIFLPVRDQEKLEENIYIDKQKWDQYFR